VEPNTTPFDFHPTSYDVRVRAALALEGPRSVSNRDDNAIRYSKKLENSVIVAKGVRALQGRGQAARAEPVLGQGTQEPVARRNRRQRC